MSSMSSISDTPVRHVQRPVEPHRLGDLIEELVEGPTTINALLLPQGLLLGAGG